MFNGTPAGRAPKSNPQSLLKREVWEEKQVGAPDPQWLSCIKGGLPQTGSGTTALPVWSIIHEGWRLIYHFITRERELKERRLQDDATEKASQVSKDLQPANSLSSRPAWRRLMGDAAARAFVCATLPEPGDNCVIL